MNPETLPRWWGPEGFSCRTKRIDLRTGGEWVFDMIAPDGTVFPNHHLYGEVRAGDRIGYTLLWGENGPKHADAWASFEDADGATKVTLGMVFSTAAEFEEARGFGAVELGLGPGQARALRRSRVKTAAVNLSGELPGHQGRRQLRAESGAHTGRFN